MRDRQTARANVLLATCIWACAWVCNGPVAAADVVPGGVLVLELPAGTATATWEGRPVMIDGSRAIVGIGLQTQPGTYQLQLPGAPGTTRAFRVVPKQYPEQRITLANPKMVNPDPENLQRIESEAARMEAVYASFTPGVAPPAFNKPINGRTSSPFGFRRVFNGEARNPHSGLDIAATGGTPVPSPAAGTVRLTGDFYFNGLSVFVDHGQGLITMVCHLSAIGVQEGQSVSAGDILGRVGATGRATGPHLHWSTSLNGHRVDPVQVVAALNAP